MNVLAKALIESKSNRYWVPKKGSGKLCKQQGNAKFGYRVALHGANLRIAEEFIKVTKELEREYREYTISSRDEDADDEFVVKWNDKCSESDLKLYKELTRSFKSSNALTYFKHPVHGTIFRFSKNGTSHDVAHNMLNAVTKSEISWARYLFPRKFSWPDPRENSSYYGVPPHNSSGSTADKLGRTAYLHSILTLSKMQQSNSHLSFTKSF